MKLLLPERGARSWGAGEAQQSPHVTVDSLFCSQMDS